MLASYVDWAYHCTLQTCFCCNVGSGGDSITDPDTKGKPYTVDIVVEPGISSSSSSSSTDVIPISSSNLSGNLCALSSSIGTLRDGNRSIETECVAKQRFHSFPKSSTVTPVKSDYRSCQQVLNETSFNYPPHVQLYNNLYLKACSAISIKPQPTKFMPLWHNLQTLTGDLKYWVNVLANCKTLVPFHPRGLKEFDHVIATFRPRSSTMIMKSSRGRVDVIQNKRFIVKTIHRVCWKTLLDFVMGQLFRALHPYEFYGFDAFYYDEVCERVYFVGYHLKNRFDLFEIYANNPPKPTLLAAYMKRFLRLLHRMYSYGFSHGDFKLENVIGVPFRPESSMLIDFEEVGCAHLQTRSNSKVGGTICYMHPGLIGLFNHSRGSDLYSMACTLVLLCTGKTLETDTTLTAKELARRRSEVMYRRVSRVKELYPELVSAYGKVIASEIRSILSAEMADLLVNASVYYKSLYLELNMTFE